jgi:hypothetical protein
MFDKRITGVNFFSLAIANDMKNRKAVYQVTSSDADIIA